MSPLPFYLTAFVVNFLFVTQTLSENTAVELRAPAFPEGVGKESYMCMTKKLPNKPMRLVEVHALAKQEIVHHILLFACSNPGKVPVGDEIVSWECLGHKTCENGIEEIIFGWGKDAPPLVYPPDIGLAVGPGSAVKYIVVQVHYLKGQPPNDDSGVRMVLSPEPRPFGAGLLSYASWFTIPPRTPSYLVNTTCCYRGVEPLTTFAMRVHTHELGRRVWLEDLKGGVSSAVLAENDPQLPQFFYNVTRHRLFPGQQLRAICDFNSSTKSEPVTVGATHEFEMCNLYMMVYSRIPFTAMCTGELNGGLGYPGALDHGFNLVEDPSGFDAPVPKESGAWGDVAGDATSVASSPDGSVWVLHRGNHRWEADSFNDKNVFVKPSGTIPQKVVMKLNADTGEVSTAFGAGVFSMPHMITADNQDNVWITDVGKHQVFKFSPEGKQLLVVGTENQPGKDETHFCKPAAVAVLLDGSFIVADGYCNNRLVKFDANGKFVAAEDLPASGAALVVHSLMVDECRDIILVAQRETGLLFMVDLQTLKLKGQYDFKKYGRVWAVKMGPYGAPILMTSADGQAIKFLQLRADELGPVQGVVEPELELSIPNTEGATPNDFAIGAAATSVTGAGSRLLALYIARICPDCGPVTKWIAAPSGFPAYATNQSTSGVSGSANAKTSKSLTVEEEATQEAEEEQAAEQEEVAEEEATDDGVEEAEEIAAEEEAEVAEELEEEATSNANTTTPAKSSKAISDTPANNTTTTSTTTSTTSNTTANSTMNTTMDTTTNTTGSGGVEVILKPVPAEPATPAQKAADAVLSKLDKAPPTGALPVGQSGSAALAESTTAKPSTTTTPAPTPSKPTTTPSTTTPSSQIHPETDPLLSADERWEGVDYDDALYYEEVARFKEVMEKKATSTPAAAVVMTTHAPQPTEVDDKESEVMVFTKYTTRSGNAMQVVLVACVIAVFLAVFAINTLGGMKAKVYHPLASLDDTLPVVSTSVSPFIMDKPTTRRRGGT